MRDVEILSYHKSPAWDLSAGQRDGFIPFLNCGRFMLHFSNTQFQWQNRLPHSQTIKGLKGDVRRRRPEILKIGSFEAYFTKKKRRQNWQKYVTEVVETAPHKKAISFASATMIRIKKDDRNKIEIIVLPLNYRHFQKREFDSCRRWHYSTISWPSLHVSLEWLKAAVKFVRIGR